ncbi:aldo/keto reductase [Anaerotruncus colihominis]|uniref:aldo/keto reductase n=1 Tax=Anaerotruncus colihominis TaxID=169435 RepID=UPI00242FC4F4|nr:aldo/keto reductase [Anaerotruncus colihominis]
MKYAVLGRSGMKVSRISMGTHHLNNPSDVDKHVRNFLYAYEKGINFFETSVTYGDGYSELILGEAVKEMKRGKQPFFIMSKTHAGDHETFRRDLENSLKRLGLEQIAAFTCLWGVKSGMEWNGAKSYGAIREMEKAREEGLIRYIAISTHMKNQELKQVMNDYPFDFNVQGFNVVNSACRMDGVRATWESGSGCIAMNPLATGDILKYPRIFNAIRIREDQSMVQAAYAYVLSVPWVHSVLGTFNCEAQIDEALAALDETPYCSEELQEVGLRLKKRIESCSLKERIEAGKLLRQRPYILREEVAALMGVYPLSV